MNTFSLFLLQNFHFITINKGILKYWNDLKLDSSIFTSKRYSELLALPMIRITKISQNVFQYFTRENTLVKTFGCSMSILRTVIQF